MATPQDHSQDPFALKPLHLQALRVACFQAGPNTPPHESSILTQFPISCHFILGLFCLFLHVAIL